MSLSRFERAQIWVATGVLGLIVCAGIALVIAWLLAVFRAIG